MTILDIIGGGLALAWLAGCAGLVAERAVLALIDWRRRRVRLPVARVVH